MTAKRNAFTLLFFVEMTSADILVGAASEGFLFRGLLLGGLATAIGGTAAAKVLATVIVVILFAFGHGCQGWAGIIDTGLYGGLSLSLVYWWRGMRLAAPSRPMLAGISSP